MMRALVWVIGLVCVTRVPSAFSAFYPDGFGACAFSSSFGDSTIYVPENLTAVDICPLCRDVLGVNGESICATGPCDGVKCFAGQAGDYYRIPYESENKCGFDGSLKQDCSECDTECIEVCNVYPRKYSLSEIELVTCAFDLDAVGTTDGDLCSGTVGFSFCEDAELYNRTCYIARTDDRDVVWSGLGALVWENCAPVFSRIHGDDDFWACPMDSPVLGSVTIYRSPYCDEFAQHYGEPMGNGHYPHEEKDHSNNGGSGLRQTLPFYLV